MKTNDFTNTDFIYIGKIEKYKEISSKYILFLLDGDRSSASRLIIDAVLNNEISIKDVYIEVFQKSLYEIGRLWELNKISIADEHYFTAATQMIMSQLYEYVFTIKKRGKKLVGACVGGELHEIGIRMVCDFFEMEGWDTVYLGANVPAEAIVSCIKEYGADLVAISASMIFNIRKVFMFIEELKRDNSMDHIKIIVGGHPFNISGTLWRNVGADAFAATADQAVKTAESLISASC